MPDRGREANAPQHIPARGWRDALLRVRAQIGEDDVGMVSAAVTYYALLALFPALAAVVSIYGLVADPAQVQEQLDAISGLPQEVREILTSQLQSLASTGSALSVGLGVSMLLSALSAMKGTKALMQAMNIAYDEKDERGFVRQNLVALGFTLAGLFLGAVALGVIVAVPAVLKTVTLGGWWWKALVSVVPYLILALVFLGSLALVYRYAPHRRHARWGWVTPGSVAATVLWLIGTILFSLYVGQFGKYNETYGSLGAVVVLLLWLYLSTYIVMLGAELNAELEHQTRRDTTEEPERPMGRRGAYVADHVGPVPEGPWRGNDGAPRDERA